jgi:hypothetical protein
MQEFWSASDLVRHRSSLIEHFACMGVSGRLIVINLLLRGNISTGVSASIVEYIGSVTVMIVALALKAFAKAIPCLTPLFASSDPSVLKRMLAYICWLPYWLNLRRGDHICGLARLSTPSGKRRSPHTKRPPKAVSLLL